MVECQVNQTLIETLRKLWTARPQEEKHRRPFYVGVRLGNLVADHPHTLSLFSSLETESQRRRLTSTIRRTFSSVGREKRHLMTT